MEVSSEEASLQRSEQLRELYESLSGGEKKAQTRRPCASLSPEDLTETEWFYLLCVSFSFHPGLGLPGTAYARRQHLWLSGANEVDSKTFSRPILAKSADIQMEEDLNFIQHIKSFFIDQQHPALTAKPALSEQYSTSNPSSSSSSSYPFVTANNTIPIQNIVDRGEAIILNNNSEEAELAVPNSSFIPSELMELDAAMEEFSLDSFPTEKSMALCSAGLELLQIQLPPAPAHPPIQNLAQGDTDTRYSQTVSSILQKNSRWWPESPSVNHLTVSFQSAFNKWNSGAEDYHHHHFHVSVASVTSQWLLKYILFNVPYLHTNWLKGKGTSPYETSHVMAECHQREKLNEKFLILGSMVPSVIRMDNPSILEDTIEYIKQLRKKIERLEARERLTGKRRMRGVEVSIIENEALLEVECVHREGLLLDLMTTLRELRVEVMMVQSWVKDDGVFVAEMRAKVRENGNGIKAMLLK